MSPLVDWSVAERVAAVAAGDEGPVRADQELRAAAAEAGRAVQSYTGLVPEVEVPEAEWVSRAEWAAINLATAREALATFEESVEAPSLPGPVGSAIGGALGLVAGAQIGALAGYASRRVLGQYEFPVLGPERPARLLFVAANVESAERELGGERRTVLRWIALHEVTHAVHFAAAPWLQTHLRGLAGELLEGSSLGISPGAVAGQARKIATRDPRETLREVWGSDPLTLLQPPASRAVLARTQTTMAAVEGYAEHVMDAAAPLLGEHVEGLRFAIERRREDRPPLARLLGWLLGMELKLRQYRDGKRFCDGVVELEGIESLNRAWEDPDALPAPSELADPVRWLQRTAMLPA